MKSQIKILEDKIEKNFPNVKQKTEMKNERKREEKQRIKPRLSTFNMTNSNKVPEREKKNGEEKIIKKNKISEELSGCISRFSPTIQHKRLKQALTKRTTMEFKNTWMK